MTQQGLTKEQFDYEIARLEEMVGSRAIDWVIILHNGRMRLVVDFGNDEARVVLL